jgi:hypothetical protein
MTNRLRIKNLASKPAKIELPIRLAGLAKTHRLIMIQKQKELQFMALCAQIRLDDFKKHRSDCQRDIRRDKRHKNVPVD